MSLSLDSSDEPMIINKPASAPIESSNKRKAVEQEQEKEIVVVKVEPVSMCDFIIRYKNLEIHTHKVVLMMYSKFFQAVLEDQECKEVTIEPQVNNLTGQPITPEAFGFFFRRLAFLTFSMTKNLSCKCEDVYLANYFIVDHYIRTIITEYTRVITGIQEYGTSTTTTVFNLSVVIEYLSFQYHYKWLSDEPRMQKFWLLNYLASNTYSMLAHSTTLAQDWKLLPDGITKQLFIQYALSKNSFNPTVTDTIKKDLLPS